MATYREELCNKDQRGIPIFSPMCAPGRTVDSSLSNSVGEKSFNNSKYGDLDCYVPPVNYPQTIYKFDDSASAKDWFNDPTYAQLSAAKNQRKVLTVPPALQIYQNKKASEKAAISEMQVL